MKHLWVVLCLIAFAVTAASAQQFQIDVVYLSDGSTTRGIVVEQIPGAYLKIRTQGGSVLVFKMSEVLKVTTELPQQIPIQKKSPGVALALSFLVVGAGQAYNDEIDMAIVHWLIAAGSLSLVYVGLEDNYFGYDPNDDDHYATIGIIFGLGNWIVSMITAPISAHEINEKYRRSQDITLLRDRLILEPYTSRKARGVMLSLRF